MDSTDDEMPAFKGPRWDRQWPFVVGGKKRRSRDAWEAAQAAERDAEVDPSDSESVVVVGPEVIDLNSSPVKNVCDVTHSAGIRSISYEPRCSLIAIIQHLPPSCLLQPRPNCHHPLYGTQLRTLIFRSQTQHLPQRRSLNAIVREGHGRRIVWTKRLLDG
jgi:hypothetical protein